ncbi:MAG: ABC transporter ATP-binding protein [Nostoc sp. DedQUE12b]|uniref:ABC transporter ATP-binding protein n=1 Tax=Nostoc sp. DedQUE12b TaxID=3075398 RepID=UPI002AD240FF|nr:ABC transporter ATP-binding protein [Nostoc sp. DedQUE12b]MDZ8084527.1 ABC transporter ATP-binding protein [Nostoc sp. DedQUE12b]
MLADRGRLKSDLPTFTSLQRLFPYFKAYRFQWLTAVLALLAVHVVEAAIPVYLKVGIDLISKQDKNILLPVLAILGLTALRFAILHFGRRNNAVISIYISYDLRQAFYAHLQSLGRGFYANYHLGDLIARATNDMESIRRFFRSAVHRLVSLIGVALIAPIFMVQQSVQLTLLLIPLLLVIAANGWYLAGRILLASAAVQVGFGALTETVQQNLKGIRTIQSHAQEEREIKHFTGVSHRYALAHQKLINLNAILTASTALGSGLMTLIVVGVGGSQVLAGQMSIGTLTAFIFYLAMILGVIKESSFVMYALLNASTAATRVFQIMDEKPEIEDAPAGSSAQPIKGEIAVYDLSYSYPVSAEVRSRLVLEQISLSISPGEMIAIIGRVGSGKSTLLRLLARQLEPNSGQIKVDGQDLRDIPLSHLRKNLSFVPQDTFLFAAPISENISFDNPERPQDLIWQAARSAQLEATINKFSAGLSTLIGERGVTLSGGQKQRTSLARGLIRQTPILLLDDCFSALDTRTEALVLSQLRSVRDGLTTVLVSHRMLAARYVDRIYVLEQGRIVETGSHDELIALDGYYAKLSGMQDET